jgi:hypothetical protein
VGESGVVVVPGITGNPTLRAGGNCHRTILHEVTAGSHDERPGLGESQGGGGGPFGATIGEGHTTVEALGLAVLEGGPYLHERLGGGGGDGIEARCLAHLPELLHRGDD